MFRSLSIVAGSASRVAPRVASSRALVAHFSSSDPLKEREHALEDKAVRDHDKVLLEEMRKKKEEAAKEEAKKKK